MLYAMRNETKKSICFMTDFQNLEEEFVIDDIRDLFFDGDKFEEDIYNQMLDAMDWYEDDEIYVDLVEFQHAYELEHHNYELTDLEHALQYV